MMAPSNSNNTIQRRYSTEVIDSGFWFLVARLRRRLVLRPVSLKQGPETRDERRGSAAKCLRRLHVDGLKGLIDAEHDRETDRRLGSRQHDHEDGEHLTVIASRRVARERQVIDVRRVEHQLD